MNIIQRYRYVELGLYRFGRKAIARTDTQPRQAQVS